MSLDYSSLEQTWAVLLQKVEWVEEHVIKLPRENSIRLLIIIGVYCLIRPYILKLGGIKAQAEEEKALDEDETSDDMAATESQEASNVSAKTSNASGNDKDATWGEKARARQKRSVRDLVEGTDEPSGVEADSDKEIEDFLRKTID